MVFTAKIPHPACIKIDVEGTEARLLKGARGILPRYRPVVFLATHSKELYGECSAFLRSLNYELEPIPGVSAQWNDEILARWRC